MNQFQFILQESPWYVLLCLLIAGAFSYYLYEKKTPWTKKLNYFLTGLRFLLFFCVSFLLLSPLVKFFNNILDRPQIVIAIDNSQSITLSENQQELKSLNSTLGALTKELEESGIEVSLQTYQGSQPTEKLEDLRFNSPVSDISGLLSTVKNNFTNKNLSGVVLISDGIFNQGYDPNYNQYTFPIHTIGLGDTVQKKDLNLKYIKNNKIAYTKTRFPIIAEIQHTGFKGKSVEIQLVQNGKVLEKKAVNVLKDDGIESVEFLASSEEKGLQRYTVKVQELAGEFTTTNNIGSAYVEILDSKEKILIIASSPHPDIKALKSALSTKENFEVDIHIPGISPYSDGRYDLVILHQVPDVMGTGSSLVEKIKSSAASLLYMLGSKTDLNQFNNHSSKLKISGRQGQKDLVSPLINGSFGKIKIENGAEAAINNFPPVSVPFGNYGFTGPAQDILLYQKIGSLLTQKPLLILTEASNKKIGVLAGEGIWQWRLREFQATKGTAVFDKLITDCLQYLSNKDDKRKLRVFPLNSEFNDSESAILETETYNDIYEKIYNVKIDLTLTSEENVKKNFSITNNENSERFVIKGLKPGIYKYTARANISGKSETTQGQFSVKNLNLEALNTKADFNVLRQLSSQTNGQFVAKQDIRKLQEYLSNQKMESVIHTNEEFLDLIAVKILFFILILIASTEWFIRKYKGSY